MAPAFAQSQRKPNIVFIVADDLGWRDSSAYHSEFYETPGIDRLAREGVLFTDAYSANPLCSPTRASLLTGQYPSRLRFTAAAGHVGHEILNPTVPATAAADKAAVIPQSRTRLPNDYVTYAELLKEAGYATAFMGKWHLGRGKYIPENQGFDTVIGGRHHPGPPPPGSFFAPWDIETIPEYPKGTHISDALTDEALSFIKAHRDQPFLLNLWYYDVHAPFQGKPKLIDKYEQLVDPDYPQKSPTMGAMIEAMDRNIERLLEELDRMGLRENTILIFTSDNGGNMYNTVDGTTPTSNFPLRNGKGNNYEGGVRVPLIVDWPGVTRAGTLSDSVVVSPDFYPTFLRMAGLPLRPEHHIDGIDFTPALRGEPHDRGPTIIHFPHYVPATGNLPSTSVRVGDFKLYRFYHDGEGQAHRYELYNLETDISEADNLAAALPGKVRELDAIIERHLEEAEVLYPVKNPNFQSGSKEGWYAMKEVQLEEVNGLLRVVSSGTDPYFATMDVGSVTGPLRLSFAMRSESSGQGQIFWRAGNKGYAAAHATVFDVQQDGEWHDYSIDLPFDGKLRSLRFDPSQGPGRIDLRDLRLVDANGRVVHQWD